jgi:hypothetical protein
MVNASVMCVGRKRSNACGNRVDCTIKYSSVQRPLTMLIVKYLQLVILWNPSQFNSAFLIKNG